MSSAPDWDVDRALARLINVASFFCFPTSTREFRATVAE